MAKRGHVQAATLTGTLIVPEHLFVSRLEAENARLSAENAQLRAQHTRDEADWRFQELTFALARQIDRVGVFAVDLGHGERLASRLRRDGSGDKLVGRLYDLCNFIDEQIVEGVYPTAMREPTDEMARTARSLINCVRAAEQGNCTALTDWISQNGTETARRLMFDMTQSRGGRKQGKQLDALYCIARPFYDQYQHEGAKWAMIADEVWKLVSQTPEEERTAEQCIVFAHWSNKKTTAAQRRNQVYKALTELRKAVNPELEAI